MLAASMDYRELAPPPHLASWIECAWLARGDGLGPQHVVPDGCVELIVHGGDPAVRVDDSVATRQPRCFVAGQLTRPLSLAPRARFSTVALRFRPCGAFPLLGVPLHELTDRSVALGDLGRGWASLEARVTAEVDDDARVRLLFDWARQRAGTAPPTRLAAPLAALLRDRGALPVDRLARLAGLSSRQLDRRFAQEVGLPPKLLSRIVRLQSVLRALRTGSRAWVDVALDCGYADQAHLARDFRALAGTTPNGFLLDEGQLSRCFTSQRRLSSFFAD
jgi:AraC-like DNA-binding protein